MTVKVPFSLLPPNKLRQQARIFLPLSQKVKKLLPFLKIQLRYAQMEIEAREYLAMCLLATTIFFIFSTILIGINLVIFAESKFAILLAPLVALFISLFVFLQQVNYPKLMANKRIRGLERNLLPALQDIMIQTNAGVPLFNVLVGISKNDYGELAKEFSKVVREINVGEPEVDALEKMVTKNPSLFFRRAIWQLVNGMKEGSDIGNVLHEITNALISEQTIQIQNYGARLNPLAMFYMLVVVVAPALGITFLTILSSFLGLSSIATQFVLWGTFSIVLFFQIMFIGLIKSRRPNLIGEI